MLKKVIDILKFVINKSEDNREAKGRAEDRPET